MINLYRRAASRGGRPALAVGFTALLAVLGVMIPASISAGAAAGAPDSFTLVADASGVTTAVVAPNLTVVDTLFEVGGSVAQAHLDSLGVSQGFAANPTPGELVLSGPGMLAGLSGLPVPNEPFPSVAQSSHPAQPDASAGSGPYLVEAHSTEIASEARATTGVEAQEPGGPSRTVSVATVHLDDVTDDAIARATVVAEPTTIGPVIIGRITTSAMAVVGSDGRTSVETGFEIGAVSVDGQEATITPEGLVVAGNDIPLGDVPVPTEELSQAGIDVRLVEGSEDAEAGTATSPSVLITVTQTLEDGVPGVIPPGQRIIVRYVVGRTSVSASAASVAGVIAPAPRLPPVTPPGTASPTGSVTLGSAPATTPVSTADLITADPPAVVATAPATGTAPAPVPTAASAFVVTRLDPAGFYPVLVLAAIAAMASMHTTRTAARRRLWQMAAEGARASGGLR